MEYARHGAPHGSVFLAREQTAGRGRYRRRWESHPGGLYLSVLLRPDAGDPVALLPHLSSVAAAEAVVAAASVAVELRWPNDLFSNGKKLGGILCEGSFRGSRAETFIVGVGINVSPALESFPPDVRERATVLNARASHEASEVGEVEIAAGVIEKLEWWWTNGDASSILARFRSLAASAMGTTILVQPRSPDDEAYRAVTRGIADDGGLIVELNDGTERILYSEDVYRLREGDDGAR